MTGACVVYVLVRCFAVEAAIHALRPEEGRKEGRRAEGVHGRSWRRRLQESPYGDAEMQIHSIDGYREHYALLTASLFTTAVF